MIHSSPSLLLMSSSTGILGRLVLNRLGTSRNAVSSSLLFRSLSTTSPTPPPPEKTPPNRSSSYTETNQEAGMPWSRRTMSFSENDPRDHPPGTDRRYYWIDVEAEKLIAQAYKLHLPDKPFPPSLGFDRKRLEDLKELPHLQPKTFSDRVALATVVVLEKIMHMFFRSKYDHHAVTLETVAAVGFDYTYIEIQNRERVIALTRM